MTERVAATNEERLEALKWRGDESRQYRGVIGRFPEEKIRHFDENSDELIGQFIDLIERVTQPTEDSEPDLDLPLERYEAWDVDTGDLLVLMRVPHKRKQGRDTRDE